MPPPVMPPVCSRPALPVPPASEPACATPRPSPNRPPARRCCRKHRHRRRRVMNGPTFSLRCGPGGRIQGNGRVPPIDHGIVSATVTRPGGEVAVQTATWGRPHAGHRPKLVAAHVAEGQALFQRRKAGLSRVRGTDGSGAGIAMLVGDFVINRAIPTIPAAGNLRRALSCLSWARGCLPSIDDRRS
jgi:hypothetical protein